MAFYPAEVPPLLRPGLPQAPPPKHPDISLPMTGNPALLVQELPRLSNIGRSSIVSPCKIATLAVAVTFPCPAWMASQPPPLPRLGLKQLFDPATMAMS